MKFLADVSIEAALVHWLRSEGHDVLWAVSLPYAYSDDELLDIADRDQRILMTYDRDFGALVFRRGLAAHGVILLRFDAPLQSERLALLQRHWPVIEPHATGHFIVVSDRKVRARPVP